MAGVGEDDVGDAENGFGECGADSCINMRIWGCLKWVSELCRRL